MLARGMGLFKNQILRYFVHVRAPYIPYLIIFMNSSFTPIPMCDNYGLAIVEVEKGGVTLSNNDSLSEAVPDLTALEGLYSSKG